MSFTVEIPCVLPMATYKLPQKYPIADLSDKHIVEFFFFFLLDGRLIKIRNIFRAFSLLFLPNQNKNVENEKFKNISSLPFIIHLQHIIFIYVVNHFQGFYAISNVYFYMYIFSSHARCFPLAFSFFFTLCES